MPKKTKQRNTVLVRLSNIRFKRFIFAAKKKLKESNPDKCSNLYINDDLTAYNLEILKSLKTEKKKLSDDNMDCFETVYSFEGRIFIKKNRSDDRSSAIWVNSKSKLQNIISEYSSNVAPSSNTN